MKKKKNIISANYLEKIPVRNSAFQWFVDEQGIVTIDVENKGFVNRIAQKLLKKPKVSHVHLDEMGSFIWPLLDSNKNIIALGEDVKAHFGDKAEPLYQRLVKYLQILESYSFIEWKA